MTTRAPPPRPASTAIVPRVFKPLREGASFEQLLQSYQEMASAYATIAAAFTSQLPKVIEEHEEFAFVQRGHERRIGDLEEWRQHAALIGRLPTMRPESTSTHEIIEHFGHELDKRVETERKNSSTPPPGPEEVAAIGKNVMAAAVMMIKAEQKDKEDADRQAAENDRRALEASNVRELSKFKWRSWAGAVVAALGLVSALVEHFIIHGGK